MLSITFADLRHRYRQFLIAVIGAGLVLGMAVLLSGLADGFRAEVHDTVNGVGADRWILNDKAAGRVSAVATFDEAAVARIRSAPGVRAADGLALLPQEVLHVGDRQVTVVVMGVPDDGLGTPRPARGTPLAASGGDIVVDSHAKIALGSTALLGSTPFRVVGTVHDRTLAAGVPIAYITLHDAQQTLLGGQDVVTAVVTRGVPAAVPAGLQTLTPGQIESSTLRSLSGGVQSIKNTRTLMWFIAALIVAALIYVSALQRVRDFAVLKALGSSSAKLFAGLCLQAVVIALLAAGLGTALSTVMTGIFPQRVTVPDTAYETLPLVAVVVGMLASLVALRRATGADPVAAFGG